MADEAVDPHTRKTITLTHRQAAGTGLSITAIFTILHFLSANYASKSDVKFLSDQVIDVKVLVKEGINKQSDLYTALRLEEKASHERMMDTNRKEIANEKDDRIRGDENESKRIDLVMELFKIKHTKTN